MTTKAANKVKRRRKGGRPRKEGALRTPSGAISRSQEEKDRVTQQAANENHSVAVEARRRLQKLNKEMAKTQLAGFEIGRLLLRKVITKDQFDSAEHFANDMARYYGLTGIPFPSPRAMNIFSVGGYQGEESESRQKRARIASSRYMALHGCLKGSKYGHHLFTTVNNICLLDMSTDNFPEKQMNMLKFGLNELYRFYHREQSGE